MLTDKAKAKLAEEIKGKDQLIAFEEYLTEICTSDAIAEKILAEGKSLEKCYAYVRNYAKKYRVGDMASVKDEEVYQVIREYYGIGKAHEEEKADAVDIMDLL